jgi:Putative MetA-pathway of phenol degradation
MKLIRPSQNFFRRQLWLSIPLFLLVSDPLFSQVNSDIKHTVSFASYFSSGDYGEAEDTDIQYFPVSYTANKGKWGAQLTVPHLQVEGIGNVLVNVGGVGRAVAGSQRERNSGIGDSTLALTYQMDPLSEASPFVDFRLDVKIPTADREKGLGTGELDYSAQVDISQNYGSSILFATVGYTFRGKTDFYAGLKDSAYLQLGAARPIGSKWNLGVFYDFREPPSTFSPEIHEVVPYVSYRLSEKWSFTGLAAYGFTDASANTALLAQISYSW